MKGSINILLGVLNENNVVSVNKQLVTFTEYFAIAMYSSFSQNILNDEVEEIEI